jgi:hypothetical protein
LDYQLDAITLRSAEIYAHVFEPGNKSNFGLSVSRQLQYFVSGNRMAAYLEWQSYPVKKYLHANLRIQSPPHYLSFPTVELFPLKPTCTSK